MRQSDRKRLLLAFAAAAEAATGLALLIVPSLVIALLLGASPDITVATAGRVAGVAMIALAVACWPDASATGNDKPYIGMLTYNVLTTLVLAQVGLAAAMSGILLWPVTILHLTLSILLARAWFHGRRARVTG
jgi:hypothetical protein